MKKWLPLIGLLALLMGIGCSRSFDKASEDSALQPTFSVDTLRVDTLYSRLSSATHRLIVYNRHEKAIELQKVLLDEKGSPHFRLNVDGRSGQSFSNLFIPPHDSLFLFVEATFPEGEDDLPTRYEAKLLFHCRGVVSKVLLEGIRLNIDHCKALSIDRDTTLLGNRPLLIRDSIIVHEGATLTLEAGTHLLLGDKAKIVVYGSLLAKGTPQNRILIEGIRRDELVEKVNYRLLPGQWENIQLLGAQKKHILRYTTIRNGRGGIIVGKKKEALPIHLELEGCILTNMKGSALQATNAEIEATNSLLSNTMAPSLKLSGGNCLLQYCTIAGFYPFDRRQGASIDLSPTPQGSEPSLVLSNSVVEGTFTVSRTNNKKPIGGEIFFDNSKPQWISLSSCYVRSPLELYTQIDNCIEAKFKPDSVFVALGKNKKTKEYTFIYNFKPYSDAPFATQKKSDTAPLYDLEGNERHKTTAWGAYEAIEREREEH